MKNNELKEKVLKNVKENIAISNICEEMGVSKKKERKFFVYKTLSACAAVILIGAIFVNMSNIQMSTNSLGQTAMDSMLVGKNESDMIMPGIQSSNSALENKNDFAGTIKDPMNDSFIYDAEDNYRGDSTEDLKQNANSEILATDKVTNVPSVGSTNEQESFSIKVFFQNIIEALLSIF